MIQEIVDSVQTLFGTRRIRRKPRIIPKEEHNIRLENVSRNAISICRKLSEAGFKAFIVGGAVRDLLIDHVPKDFDVATDATPEQVKRLTKRAIIIGRRFRLVHVIHGPEIIEVSTFRGLRQDGVEKTAEGRVIDDNVFGEQWEDAARRDFTVNAMYYNPLTEEVYDYHSGMLDVRKKRIRMIGDPEQRYREDPVRILRAIRIASKLGFAIDPKTAAPMQEMQTLLKDVPEARLFDEMIKMLTSGAGLACLDALKKYGISEHLPLLNLILEGEDDPMVRKSLERCDIRINKGMGISQSFIYATLLWKKLKDQLTDLKKNEGMRGSIARRWSTAIFELCEGPATRGIQKRYLRDTIEIWRLQPKFEKRTGSVTLKVLEHPRFRAAYDFMLIRASVGEISHEIADWWTAFEAAPVDERYEMVKEQEQLAREASLARRSAPEAEAEEKPKARKRNRRKKAKRSDLPEASAENLSEGVSESAEKPVEPARIAAVEEAVAEKPTPKRRPRRKPKSVLLVPTANKEE